MLVVAAKIHEAPPKSVGQGLVVARLAADMNNARLPRRKRRVQHSSVAKQHRVGAHERPTRQQQAPHARRKNKVGRLVQHEARSSAQVASWHHIVKHAATSDR